jgi:hypothetical protein
MLGYDGVCSSTEAHKKRSNLSTNMNMDIVWKKLSPTDSQLRFVGTAAVFRLLLYFQICLYIHTLSKINKLA